MTSIPSPLLITAIESDEAIMALIDDVDAETAAKTDCGDELGMREGVQLRVEAIPAGTETSSSDESSSSSDESQAFESLANSIDEAPPPTYQDLWKVKGGNYHMGSSSSELHFKCEVKISHSATRVIHAPRFLAPKCKRCFGIK